MGKSTRDIQIQSGLLMGVGGLMVGFGAIQLVKRLTKNKEREVARKDKSEKKGPPKLFGFEIKNECLCGEKVEPYERQSVVFNQQDEAWYRKCAECMNKKKPEVV